MGNIATNQQFHDNLNMRRGLMIKDAIAEALGGLERKAATAEARAMDIRLRIDHERIAQLIAGQELVSRLQQLVETATDNLAGQAHLRALVEQLVDPMERAAKTMGSIENAADFACDKLTRGQPPASRSRLRTVAAALVSVSAQSGAKVFFEHLLRLLG